MTRTSSILFWFGLIIIASLGLYRTSDHVQELDRQLRDINAAIVAEKQSIHVLNTEWVYLTNPERIGTISRKHLALRPTTPQQVATMDSLSERLPTRTEAMSTVAVTTAPMANIKTALAAHIQPQTDAPVSHPARQKPAIIAVSVSVPRDTSHVRDHMLMVQRTASAEPLPGDTIGALIGQLNAEH